MHFFSAAFINYYMIHQFKLKTKVVSLLMCKIRTNIVDT